MVFKWPTMDIILDQAKAHTTVKDLDFRFGITVALKTKDDDFCLFSCSVALITWLNCFAAPMESCLLPWEVVGHVGCGI